MGNNKTVDKLWHLLPAHIRGPAPSSFLSDNYVVLDFETTTEEFGTPHNPNNSLLCACWIAGPSHPFAGSYKSIGNEFDMGALREHVELADFVVAHNAKFELGWLERCGIDLKDQVAFCTKIGEKVIAGNRPWSLYLDDCVKRRGFGAKDDVGRLIRLGVDTVDIPMRWLVHYCMKDVELTERLFLDQREQMKRDGLLPVAWTRNILTPVLYDIERYGLVLDTERVEKTYQYFKAREEKLEAEWMELTGGVNVRSPKQKQELLYDTLKIPLPKNDMGEVMTTDTGAVSTDVAALGKLKPKTKQAKAVVQKLLDLNSVKQSLSKYVDKLKECADTEGVLRAEFNQTVASSHRLSSTGRRFKIQLQNFQRRFRPLVHPRKEGWSIGDGDASGIEFRTAVDLAKDAQGRKDIEEGADIHAFTASIIFGDSWDPDAPSKSGGNAELRYRAKAHTFKPLYGGQSGTPAQRRYYEAFKRRYASVHDMQRGWAETVLKTKQLRTASGLIFYWPDCRLSSDGKYIKYTTQIFDLPVQSFATAELAPTATVYLWHLMKAAEMESFLINIVHDSAVGEIHPDEKDLWAELLVACMSDVIVWYLKEVYNYEWTTPLASEVEFGHHWTDDSDDYMKQWEVT